MRSDGLRTKKRILSACVRLFLENGYHQTTLLQIYEEAKVSCSSFQNIFHSKDGVLYELLRFMFDNQFSTARDATGAALPPVYVYAAETAIQMTLVELNENLRDIYIEAYTQKETLDYIQHETAKELYRIFGPYQPELTEYDFYLLDLGTSGLMRGYMAQPCGDDLSLEKKLRAFLMASLRVFKVPEDEVQRVLGFIAKLDMRAIAQGVMETLFQAMAVHYDFSLSGILPEKAEAEQ